MTDARIRTYYHIRARRPSDFAAFETEHEGSEAAAHREASKYVAQGYDVTVDRVVSERLAEWKAKPRPR